MDQKMKELEERMASLMSPSTVAVWLPEQFTLASPFLNKAEYDLNCLHRLESIIKVCELYQWLNNWFSESFVYCDEVELVKERCGLIIEAIIMENGKADFAGNHHVGEGEIRSVK